MRRDKNLEDLISGVVSKEVTVSEVVQRKKLSGEPTVLSEETDEDLTEDSNTLASKAYRLSRSSSPVHRKAADAAAAKFNKKNPNPEDQMTKNNNGHWEHSAKAQAAAKRYNPLRGTFTAEDFDDESYLDEAREPREQLDRRYRLSRLRTAQRNSLDSAAKAKGPMSDKKKAAIAKQGEIDKKLERNKGKTSQLYSKYRAIASIENHKNHKDAAHAAAQELGGKKIHEDEHGTTYAITSHEHAPVIVHISPSKGNHNYGQHDIKVTTASGASHSNSDLYPQTDHSNDFKPSTFEAHKARISGALQNSIDSAIRNRKTGWE